MKTILLIFIFAFSLKADYLVKYETIDNNIIPSTFAYCATDYYFTSSNLISVTSTGITSINIRGISNLSFLDGYQYINGSCRPKTTNYNNLGLTENQYNFLMALSGVLIGSLILFFIIGL